MELQRLAGNRAVATLIRPRTDLNRSGVSATTAAVQRESPGSKSTAGETVEISWEIKELSFGLKVTFKATLTRKGGKILEEPKTGDPRGPDSAWSLGENKATLEKASGRWGRKLASSVARQDFRSGEIFGFPGLRFRLTVKGPEGTLDLSKGEASLDVMKIQGAVEGDFVTMLDYVGFGHLKDRVTVKGSLQIEKKISPADLVRLKMALTYYDEAKRAAKEAEEQALKYVKHKEQLAEITKKRTGLERQLQRRQKALERASKALEAAEGRDRYGKPLRKRPSLRVHKEVAEKAVRDAERALLHNKNALRVQGHYMRRAADGLAAAGARLKAAGHRLDAALAKVTDPLAKPIKRTIEKLTAKIMKRLAGKLLAKGLGYLIPGLNIAMTLIDLGSILFSIFGDSAKNGVPGGDGGDDATGTTGGSGAGKADGGDADAGAADTSSGGASGGASGGSSGGGSSGSGTTGKSLDTPGPSGGGATGTAGTAAPPIALSPTAKELLEAFNGDPLTLDAEAVKAVNDGVPAMTADEKAKLLDRLRAEAPGATADPYALVVEIQAQLAEIRAGEDTISFDEGKTTQPAPSADTAAAEPPKTLLPFTRVDARNTIEFDDKQKAFVLKPGFRNYADALLPAHPDGLQVKLTQVDVKTTFPSAGKGHAVVSLTFDVQVVSVPAGADASYPYAAGQTKQEKMTFLYDPRSSGEDAWGEIDYSHLAQLRTLLRRSGRTWTLAQPGGLVRFQAATVRVEKILEARQIKAADGSALTKFAVEVVPTEIHSARAGYTTSRGWVDFVPGTPVTIDFDLPD